MSIENQLLEIIAGVVETIYGPVDSSLLQIQKTRKEFEGDFTLVVFPLLKTSRKSPDATAQQIGEVLVETAEQVKSFNVIKGFLNIALKESFWSSRFNEIARIEDFGKGEPTGRTIMVEYSSPNTNKPLHLGHIRNNLLGFSVSNILSKAGHKVIKVNLVNDRGIHICKSMIAWQLFGDGETPESSGLKGDHLVGKYYVEFDKAYKAQIKELMEGGMSEDQAKKEAPIILDAQDMLRKWEAKDAQVRELWEMMNGWVYEGFDITYKALGVDFDHIYHESQTYLLGKSLVEDGLDKGVFFRKDDGSVWVDLTSDGLDQKLLLRGDGTSVYMTQDLGTALERYKEYGMDGMIYVVGNEQNYHFQVLKLILSKLGYGWADQIYHLSYGMVELPEGKMKSREGTVVDADDLIEAMISSAREVSAELGKGSGDEAELDRIGATVGMGALKYFILKVDPRKTMLFDPKESIDFNGNTGPFIQYTYARIKSVLRKAGEAGIDYRIDICGENLVEKEIALVKLLSSYAEVVSVAAADYSPAVIAAYIYDLAKEFNGYYHDHSIMKEENPTIKAQRLYLSEKISEVIASGMLLLGISVPERM